MSENTRKTKVFCSFSHIQVATFGVHFGCPFGVVSWATLFKNLIKIWCPVADSNGLFAGMSAQNPVSFTKKSEVGYVYSLNRTSTLRSTPKLTRSTGCFFKRDDNPIFKNGYFAIFNVKMIYFQYQI